MVRAPSISDLFSNFGAPAKIKLLLVGSADSPSEDLLNQLRSLNLEHVSPAGLIRQEISRRTPLGLTAERNARHGQPVDTETTTAVMRRWFWSRKPDAGFALTGFPATLLQAILLDEWLDARDETLHGALAPEHASRHPVVEHYRTQGLLIETTACGTTR